MDPALQEGLDWLEPRARDEYPNTFAGLWITGENPETDKIKIAFTAGAAAKVAALAEDFPYPEMLEAVTFEVSMTELEELQLEMRDDRELAHDGELEVPDMPGGHFDLDIDVKQNAVVVISDELTEDSREWFEASYGEEVVFEQGPIAEPNQGCTGRNNCAPLRGGLRITDPQDRVCSTAFTATGPAGNRVMLSAGHGCPGGSGSARYHSGVQYGEVLFRRVHGRVDVSRHSVNNPFLTVPRIFITATETNRAVRSMSTWENLVIDAKACKSGAGSQHQCDDIIGKHAMPDYVDSAERFVRTLYCSQDGDSGASVFRNERAHGIHSGNNGVTCNSGGHRSYVGHIEYALNASNSNLVFTP